MWATKLPRAEEVVERDRKLTMVHCKVCNKIEGQEKLLVPKFDSLQNHVGKHKCKVT
jgi:hypothetical protein